MQIVPPRYLVPSGRHPIIEALAPEVKSWFADTVAEPIRRRIAANSSANRYLHTHPILGDELRALRRLQREQKHKSPFVFTSERGAPFSPPDSRA
jgi:hypothetical protein